MQCYSSQLLPMPESLLMRLLSVFLWSGNWHLVGLGTPGVISQGEKDYKIILSRQSALADFERLYFVGNLQAKSYALIGVHQINSKNFEELARSARTSKEEATIERGCIISRESIGAIVKQIELDQYPGK